MTNWSCPNCGGGFPDTVSYDNCQASCPGHCPWCGAELATGPDYGLDETEPSYA